MTDGMDGVESEDGVTLLCENVRGRRYTRDQALREYRDAVADLLNDGALMWEKQRRQPRITRIGEEEVTKWTHLLDAGDLNDLIQWRAELPARSESYARAADYLSSMGEGDPLKIATLLAMWGDRAVEHLVKRSEVESRLRRR